jgi:DNA-binding CsgD family transcriptional regulator
MVFSTSGNSSPRIQPDRWEREIELQKTSNLTPSEASIYVARESGLSLSDIADVQGLSIQTVKNTLTTARKKINGEGTMEFYISKTNQSNNDSSMNKLNLSQVLSYLCRELGYDVLMMSHTIVIKGFDRTVPGDYSWFKDNVERMVDMIGTRNDAMASERAKRMVAVYKQRMMEQEVKTPMFGHAVLKYYLDRYYIPYDVNEVD